MVPTHLSFANVNRPDLEEVGVSTEWTFFPIKVDRRLETGRCGDNPLQEGDRRLRFLRAYDSHESWVHDFGISHKSRVTVTPRQNFRKMTSFKRDA